MSYSLMAHMIAGYPRMEDSLKVAEALVQSGISYLEVQFPFSDPSADGPLIQNACMQALQAGFTTTKGFALIKAITHQHTIPVFLMSYANLLYTPSMENFIQQAKAAGITGLIVPDLPYDYNAGFFAACRRAKIAAVPVVVVGIAHERLQHYRSHPYIYAALRAGTTGKKTEITDATRRFLSELRTLQAHVLGGFGIRSSEQVQALSGLVDTCVVGSALIPLIEAAEKNHHYGELSSFLHQLIDNIK